MANFWPLVGVSALMGIIWSALSYTLFVGIFYVVPLFSGVLAGGMFNFFLMRVRGQPTTIGDAFAGFTKAFGALFVAGLLVYVFRTIGFVLLILQGIYLTVAYSFTFLLPIDKGLGFWEAMETSRITITRQWWSVFGLLLLALLIMFLGALALGVGIFVAIPLVVGAITYAYEDLCNPKK